MKIKNKNEFGKLSEIEINDFELVNSINLPNEYRNFLLNESNGGKPIHNTGTTQRVISYLLGMHNGPFYASLYKYIDVYKNRLPLSSFPIASDPFGNLFIMSLHPEGWGHIYFWDHEGETKNQDGHYTENCSFVAYSFNEFINSFTETIYC